MTTATHESPTEELPIWGLSAVRAPRSLHDTRFAALEAAIREHEGITSSGAVPRRPRDHALYRTLRELGEPS
jgi:hypothetical protein